MSKKLVEDFGFAHLSSGDMLRSQIQQGSDLGMEAKVGDAAYEHSPGVPYAFIHSYCLGATSRTLTLTHTHTHSHTHTHTPRRSWNPATSYQTSS